MNRITALITIFLLFLGYGYAGDFHDKAYFSTGFWVKNQGQMPPDILYYSSSTTGRVYIRKNDIVIQEIEPASRVLTDHAQPDKRRRIHASERRVFNSFLKFPGIGMFDISEERSNESKINIFRSKDRGGWTRDISTFSTLRIRNISSGIDMVLDADAPGPGMILTGDISRIDSIDIDAYGRNLPFLRIMSRGRHIGDYDPASRSIIRLEDGRAPLPRSDPSQMLWGTFLGGAGYDHCSHISLDSEGNILIAGITDSSDIPVPDGLYTSFSGEIDMYVAKLNSSGNSLIWATYIGGTGNDDAVSVIADSQDNIIVYGETNSTDIPVPGGMYTSFAGASDLYIAKISPGGDSMIWGTYLGGSGDDMYSLAGSSLVLDSNDNIVLVGTSSSDDIPVPNGYDDELGDDFMKMYIAKINSEGTSVMWGTYLGGSGFDYGISVDMDSLENIVVGGYTQSFDIPVPGGYDTVFNGEYDMYIAKLTADGTDLLWGTFLGGTSNDECFAVKCDSNDEVILAGSVQSADIPVPNGIITSYIGGYWDIYTAKLNSSGNQLLWGTFLGSAGLDPCYGMALDAGGNAVIIGGVGTGGDVQTPDGFDTEYNGGDFDMYCAIVSSAGDELLWASFVGGNDFDLGYAVAVDGQDNIIIAGDTALAGDKYKYDIIPTPNGYDQTFNGESDMYLAKIKPFKDGPDASVISADMGFSPADPMPGDTVQLTARVYNLGDTGLESGNCSFYYSMEPGIDLNLIGTQPFGMLAPAEYADIALSWNTDPELVPDTYIITAVLTGIIPEDSNPDNNSAYIEVPLPVDLGYFRALGITDMVNISWMTVSETDNLGFNLYRLNLKKLNPFISSPPVKLNSCLIEGHGTTSEPSYYSFTDRVKSRGNYMYILESVSTCGETRHYKTRVSWIL